MEGCTPGASIEVGLNIESHGQHRFQITFDILQSRSLAIPQSIATSELKLNVFTTESIRYSHGTLSIGRVNDISTRYLVLYNLPSGSDNTQKRLTMERSLLDLRNKVQYASEPTLKELIDFIEKLKGKRMILYATERSIFAKHVTSCLASWNVDISHIPTSTIATIMTTHSSSSSITTSNLSPSLTAMSTGSTTTSISSATSSLPGAPPSMKTPTPATEEEHIHSIPPTFLLIDDDINTLDKLLQDYRNQHLQQQQQQQHQQQHQQHMSSTASITPSSSISLTSIQQELASNTSSSSSSTRKSRRQQKTMAIIYFSYLKDYRRVREVIMQTVSIGIQPPRVIIIPKPAGPRRFLTALHMGWYDSIIDPQFSPMATSPLNCPPHQHYAAAQAMTSPASFLYSTGSTALTPPTPNESIKRSSSPGGSTVSRHEESHLNYFSPRPSATTNATATTSSDANNNGILSIPSFGGSSGTATTRSPPHHLSTTTTTAASITTTTTTNSLTSSSPPIGLTGSTSSSSSSSSSPSLPALVSSANANSRRRVRSKSSTFHPPNRRMVDLGFSSSPLAIDSKLQQESHYYQHHHPNGFIPLNSMDLATTTTTAKQHTSLPLDNNNNNTSHSQAHLGIGIDIPIHDQQIDSFTLESNAHDNNNNIDINDMTSPLRISIHTSMNDQQQQQQQPSTTTTTTTTSSSLLIQHNDNENYHYNQQQLQERHHDLTLPSSMAGPLISKDMTPSHSDHNNNNNNNNNINNINNNNEIHDTNELSNNNASTNQVTSPKQPNLKFKISNRKKKDKNKHTPWWSPPINVLIVEDNMINQAILSTWMKKHKIKYEVASDGKQAVEKWKKGGFHLILMDIQLPVMSGIDATKTIREIEKNKRIGVLPSKWDHIDNGIPKQGEVHTNDNTTTANNVTQENKDHNDTTTTTTITTTTATTINTTNSTSSSNNNEIAEESLLAAAATTAAFQSPVIIVALTASSHESDRQAALSAGCNDFLTKPVSLEWLEKKIMEWGCMQALIDVEGWRQWKRITQHSPSSSITQRTSTATTSTNLLSAATSSSLSTVPPPPSPTNTITKTTTPSNNAVNEISYHSNNDNNDNNNQPTSLSHTHHHRNQHHHHKRKEELESMSSTLMNNNNDNNSNHGHGIILQGASTLMNKRVSMKTRMVLRGVES
ncbi:unnamed protein product [Cunninghamella echinulata]